MTETLESHNSNASTRNARPRDGLLLTTKRLLDNHCSKLGTNHLVQGLQQLRTQLCSHEKHHVLVCRDSRRSRGFQLNQNAWARTAPTSILQPQRQFKKPLRPTGMKLGHIVQQRTYLRLRVHDDDVLVDASSAGKTSSLARQRIITKERKLRDTAVRRRPKRGRHIHRATVLCGTFGPSTQN